MLSTILSGIKTVGRIVKPVINRFVSTAKRTVSNAIYNSMSSFIRNSSRSIRNIFNGVRKLVSGNALQSSLSFANAAKQADQNACRQQQINIAYAKATGNKGLPKIREGLNLGLNWNKGLQNRMTHFCQTAVKAKKDKSPEEQQRENLEKAFGPPNKYGKYEILSMTGSGDSQWLSLEEVQRKVEHAQKVNWKGVGVSTAILATLLFGPGALASLGFGSVWVTTVGSGGALVFKGIAAKELITGLVASGVISAALGQVLMSLDGNSGSGNSNNISDTWGDQTTIEDHYYRHGGDFNSRSADEYVKSANKFFKDRNKYQVKVDNKGVTRVYDPETNTFGAYNPDGTIRTYFKPVEKEAYFRSQHGK